jgi:hypothetical protein
MTKAHTKLVVADQRTERPQQTLIFCPLLRSFGKSLCYRPALQLLNLQFLFIGPIGVLLVCKSVHTGLSRENWHRHVVRDAARWRTLRATGVEGVERGSLAMSVHWRARKKGGSVDSTCGRQEVASAVRLSCGDVWRQKAVSSGLAVIAPPFRAVRAALCHATFNSPVHLDRASKNNRRVTRIAGRILCCCTRLLAFFVVRRCCLCFGFASVGSEGNLQKKF